MGSFSAWKRMLGPAVGLILVCYFGLWYFDGVFGGQVYVSEDTAAYFFSNRAVHHSIAAAGDWSFWDPLPGLGQPRLANIQNGSFAPLSALFYIFPTASMFAVYPAIALGLISVLTFALYRARGLTPWPAAFGALSWTTLGSLTNHIQHLPVIETLIWLPLTLLGWQLALNTRRGFWVVVAGLGFALQCFGSSPQYLIYNALLMSLWIGVDLLAVLKDRRELLQRLAWAGGIVFVGLGLASWQLLPFLEMAQESHRSLLSDTGTFGGLYRAAPREVLLALAAEAHWFMESPVLAYGAPYRSLPNLSVLTLIMAGAAFFRRPRPWALAVGAVLFLVGMLGDDGFVMPMLSRVVPFVDQLRAPMRMIIPAAFLISWIAAVGLQRLQDGSARLGSWISIAALGWVAMVGWTLKRPLDHYVEPANFRVPIPIAEAQGRVAVDFHRSEKGMPVFLVNAGLAVGVPTLLMREVLIPRNFFEAYFASQFGSLGQLEAVDRLIVMSALPVVLPAAPMMRAFRLETLVRYRNQRVTSERIPGTLDRFTLVPEVVVGSDSSTLWALAGSADWNPRETVILRQEIPELLSAEGLVDPAMAPGGRDDGEDRALAHAPVRTQSIRIILDEPAEQILDVDSTGGILVTSELYFPGWTVTVDGEPADMIEADLALRGVVLSAGPHRVHWVYRPTWLEEAWFGLALSALTATALIFGPTFRRSSR